MIVTCILLPKPQSVAGNTVLLKNRGSKAYVSNSHVDRGWVQTSLMTQEAALHVLLSGTIAEVTQAVAQVRVPLGLPGSQPAQLTSPDTEAKLQLM